MHNRNVITWQAPNGSIINVCTACAARLDILRDAGDDRWPANRSGEYCSVSHGLHRGSCDLDDDLGTTSYLQEE